MCRLILWCLLFVGVGGVAMASSKTEKMIADYIAKLDAKDIQQVVICQEKYVETDLFADDSTRNDDDQLLPLATVTNRADIDSLVADLKGGLSKRVSLGDLPFSGILSYQVYVTKQKTFLVTKVILGEEGIVAASIGRRQNKGFRLTSDDMILVKSPSFSKTIQRLMNKNSEGEEESVGKRESGGDQPSQNAGDQVESAD